MTLWEVCRHCASGVATLAVLVAISDSLWAADVEPRVKPGTQEVGLTTGALLPLRLSQAQSTKLQGVGLAPSWMITLTDPIDLGWFSGQLSLGAELPLFRTDEPLAGYGVGFTPKIKYSFVALGRLRPYLEGGGGPIWTDLGGRVPEQPGQFNFLLTATAGCAWFLTPQTALTAGYRFGHISNAGTRHPNSGLNFSQPFLGFLFYY